MTGTLINTAAVAAGALLGLAGGRRVKPSLQEHALKAMGVFTLALGISLFLKTQEPLLALVSLVAGGLIGTAWGLTRRIGLLGDFLKRLIHRNRLKAGERFTEGFVTASVLFCVGPMTILGSLNDGLRGDWQLLAIKSAMDFVASLTLAATLGWGVLVSGLTVLFVQGSLTLSAAWLSVFLSNDRVMADLTATGGLLVVIIGFQLIRVGKWQPADFLPALFLCPLLSSVAARFLNG